MVVSVSDGYREVSVLSSHHLVSLVPNNCQSLPLEFLHDFLVKWNRVHHGPVNLENSMRKLYQTLILPPHCICC